MFEAKRAMVAETLLFGSGRVALREGDEVTLTRSGWGALFFVSDRSEVSLLYTFDDPNLVWRYLFVDGPWEKEESWTRRSGTDDSCR